MTKRQAAGATAFPDETCVEVVWVMGAGLMPARRGRMFVCTARVCHASL